VAQELAGRVGGSHGKASWIRMVKH
jgi:hypothetical protein